MSIESLPRSAQGEKAMQTCNNSCVHTCTCEFMHHDASPIDATRGLAAFGGAECATTSFARQRCRSLAGDFCGREQLLARPADRVAMTSPISGSGSSPWSSWTDSLDAEALDYCQNANTVTAGALCGEDTVVSDACRAPVSDVDAFVCDDRKMAGLQDTIVSGLKDVAKMIFGGIVGRAK